MKERYEVLRQIRLYMRDDIETFTKELGFSSAEYVKGVESGRIANVEYIYDRYAKLIGIKSVTIKMMVKEAEKNHYTSQEIASELRRILKVD